MPVDDDDYSNRYKWAGIECITVMERMTRKLGALPGTVSAVQALKYVWRLPYSLNPVGDATKAIAYLRRYRAQQQGRHDTWDKEEEINELVRQVHELYHLVHDGEAVSSCHIDAIQAIRRYVDTTRLDAGHRHPGQITVITDENDSVLHRIVVCSETYEDSPDGLPVSITLGLVREGFNDDVPLMGNYVREPTPESLGLPAGRADSDLGDIDLLEDPQVPSNPDDGIPF